jgi:polyhydroxybutyrate depolymerase
MAAVAVVLLTTTAACSKSDDGESDAGGDAGSTVPSTSTTEPVELAAAVEPAGTVSHDTITVDGRERTYRMYVPSQLPADGPVPLVLAFHGGFGWGDQFATTNHIEGLAESNGFVVVHPDGVKIPNQPGGVWNGGVCCGIAAREDVDDVAFVDALIDRIEAEQDIDPARVFALGHSNGGIMSYRLACELSDRIAAVGVVAGTLGIDSAACEPEQPVSVIHVHGDADNSLPIDGGIGRDSLAGVAFPPPHDGFATLADAAGCPEATGEAEAAGDNPDLTIERRQPCEDGTAAEFVTIAGGPHAWPGGTPRMQPRTGAGYEGYDATAEIVSFLLSHPRPA